VNLVKTNGEEMLRDIMAGEGYVSMIGGLLEAQVILPAG
jgi:hypothetical protein